MYRFFLKSIFVVLLLMISVVNASAQDTKWMVLELSNGLTNSFLLDNNYRINVEQDSVILNSENIRASYPKTTVRKYYVVKGANLQDEVESVIADGISVEHIAPNVLRIVGLPQNASVTVHGSNGVMYHKETVTSTSTILTLAPYPSGVYIIHSPGIGSIKVVKK